MDPRSHAVSNAQWVIDRGLRRTETAVEVAQLQVTPHPQPAATPVIVEQKAIQDKTEPRFSITTAATTIRAITGQEFGLWQAAGLEPRYGSMEYVSSISILTTAMHPDQLANASTFSYSGFDPKKSNIVLKQDDVRAPKFEMKPLDKLIARRVSNGISVLANEIDEFLKLSKVSTSFETIALSYA